MPLLINLCFLRVYCLRKAFVAGGSNQLDWTLLKTGKWSLSPIWIKKEFDAQSPPIPESILGQNRETKGENG